ncbi:MAG: hypothetical protein LBP43_06220 [Treponema sp.]|jgi:hypothetical protein|nr:hypothetical protein [Treponema sp.]
MPIQPEKLQQEAKPSMEEAKMALIRAGYYRLSGADKRIIAGKAEALKFAEETAKENEENGET